MASRIDWGELRLEFIHDPEKANLKQFCGKRKLSYSTVSKRAGREEWETERQTHWQKVEQAATEQVAELQVGVMARDVAQKLSQIQAMKMTALKYAGGTEDHAVAYDKPHEAVAAYERLEKLERLILGESTEHIKVDDARQMVSAVIQVIREEVRDLDTIERIAARLAGLGPAGTRSPDADATARALH